MLTVADNRFVQMPPPFSSKTTLESSGAHCNHKFWGTASANRRITFPLPTSQLSYWCGCCYSPRLSVKRYSPVALAVPEHVGSSNSQLRTLIANKGHTTGSEFISRPYVRLYEGINFIVTSDRNGWTNLNTIRSNSRRSDVVIDMNCPLCERFMTTMFPNHKQWPLESFIILLLTRRFLWEVKRTKQRRKIKTYMPLIKQNDVLIERNW